MKRLNDVNEACRFVSSNRAKRDWGKHRTEVTEVTEGERGVGDERVWWTSVADG